MSRTRRPKRRRRAAAAESRQQGLSLGIVNAYSNGVRFMTAPAIVMQVCILASSVSGCRFMFGAESVDLKVLYTQVRESHASSGVCTEDHYFFAAGFG